VYKWRQEFLEKAPGVFETKQTAATVQNEQAERIAELERLVGQLTMENALLKNERVGWKHNGGETGYDRDVAAPGQCQTTLRGV